MSRDALDTYKDYPTNLYASVGVHDLTFYRSRLLQNAPSLFVSEPSTCDVEVRQHIPIETTDQLASCDHSCTKNAAIVSNLDELRSILNRVPSRRSTMIITIHRANSWSRMKITLGMFQLLCTNSQVTPRFLSLVEGMRNKISPKDEHFMSCYTQWSTAPEQSDTDNAAHLTYDICYNLRHFEKNGRNLQDPWSCRQTVTHQKYHFGDATSSWIIVQPPELWSTSVDKVKLCRVSHPLNLHLHLLSLTTIPFRVYLDYISTELLSLDQRVSFEKPLDEFDFDFALSQHVQALRRKLHHVVTILEGTQATVRTISAFAKEIQRKAGISTRSGECFLRELDNISHDLHSHLTTSSELLNLSNDIKSMVNAILEFRNQDVMKTNGIQLQKIAENDSKGNKAVADIAQWTYNDSRTMRIATVIAMLYLPASLVFALFSTCFVELQGSGTGLLVHKEVWIAMLSILVLIGGNSIFFWLWNRRGKKRHSYPSPKAWP